MLSSVARAEVGALRITGGVEADTALLPDSRIIKAEFVASEDGHLVGSGRSFTTVLPPEAIVRELRDADLETVDGVVDLLATLGLDFALPLDLQGLGLIARQRAPKGSFPQPPLILEGWYVKPRLHMAVASHGPGTRMIEGIIRPVQGPPEPQEYEVEVTLSCGHWRQVAQRLRLVRAAVNHYVAHEEGHDPTTAWLDEGFEFRVDHKFREPSTREQPDDLALLVENSQADAWRVFIAVHAQLLRDQFPSIVASLQHRSATLEIRALPSSLASALMVQMHNLIVDGLEIRRCANETCGRPFTRQRGRALKGQYRNTGVMYCDAACAKAQMQREYRRRNRQRRAAALSDSKQTRPEGARTEPG
jgi:hypothetical protein